MVHEFAHALVAVHYGENAQGVEHHGPEFVGVLCYLLAGHFEVDVGTLLFSAAVDGELRVLPFDPAGTN